MTQERRVLELDGLVIKTPDGGRIELGADKIHGHPEIAIYDAAGTRRTELLVGLLGLVDEHEEIHVDLFAGTEGSGLALMDSSMEKPADDLRRRVQIWLDNEGTARFTLDDTNGEVALEAEAFDHEQLDLHGLSAAELRVLLETHQTALAAAERRVEQGPKRADGVLLDGDVSFERMWVRRVREALRCAEAHDARAGATATPEPTEASDAEPTAP